MVTAGVCFVKQVYRFGAMAGVAAAGIFQVER